MKLGLLFFFAITTPFFIFLTDVLYGGTSPETLKKGLADTPIYKNISDFLIQAHPEGKQDEQTAELSQLIYKRFTPDYLQNKTEKLIDDSHRWIVNDAPPPILSFTDIKTDIQAHDPALNDQLEQIKMANNQMTAEASLNEFAGDMQLQTNLDPLTALTQNDFTVPVGSYFAWIKNFYRIMQIAHPIVVILLLGSLLLLIKINPDWYSRLKWISAALLTASVFGLGMIVFNTLSIQLLSQVTISNSENFQAAFAPILLQLMNVFMERYAYFQTISNVAMVVIAIASGVAMVMIQKHNVRKQSVAKK